jgi:fructuronate reductase
VTPITTEATLPPTGPANLPGLNAFTLPARFRTHPGPVPSTGIVHLGLGNFHRSHLAVYTAAAVAARGGNWGIYAYSLRGQELPAVLRSQDLLYSVVQIAPGVDTITVPAMHTACLGGDTDSLDAVAEIARPSTKIISITVTEHGYTFSPATHGLDLNLPSVQADLGGQTSPQTVIGLIARGLQQRARTHRQPVTVLSCDNLSENGDHAQRLVRHFAELLPADDSAELLGYLNTSVSFPNSMVDRIVPDTDDRHRAMAAQRLGVRDAAPVPAEPFSMWVLQDDFAAGRPAWELAGAIFTDDVAPYELMKLRLLNGTHSMIAYLGALDGRETIPEARAQEFITRAAQHVLYGEYLPTLTIPAAIDADVYIAQLFGRWSNSVLADATSRVGSNGSVKLPQRVTEPARFHLGRGVMPHYICLTVAAFLACHAPLAGYQPGPYARAMVDPAKTRLHQLAAESATPAELVGAIFSRGDIFHPSLADLPGFTARITTYLDLIVSSGIRAAADVAEQAHLARWPPKG